MEAAENHFRLNKIVPSHMNQSMTMNVFFHVISQNETLEGGNVPDSQLVDQINVMNEAYTPAGISWVLAGTTRTVNATWFNEVAPLGIHQTTMKKVLRVGGARDLNVYTVGFSQGDGAGLLGYSTFPSTYASNPLDDGIVILYSSVPGGTTVPYDLGQTLTHEAGHWVGLYHTFEGGCGPTGDRVADTPSEAGPAFGCPIGRDSCLSEGVDPIHNFMDYSDDACMSEFTPGQIERMKAQISTYRDAPAVVIESHSSRTTSSQHPSF
ncbi:hypothetical protein BDQ17DRAFT_1465759 [Cyathus striatus]|nr:hypothetical protein BDQ17DRAFT_1465759 [Cyathus striatus]